MRSYCVDPRFVSRHMQPCLFVGFVFCNLVLTAHASAGSERTEPERVARETAVTGPTIELSYSRETFKNNPISSFMYFVPLISLTLVGRETSANNLQEVGAVSYVKKTTTKSFQATLDFEIRGAGFHKNTFDPEGMIAARLEELKKNESLTNALDYIQFRGEGAGRIVVKGTIANSTETVTGVDVQFNVRGRKSPVTIGLYDIVPKDGQYRYENRSNESVARVNTLSFKRSTEPPRMGVTVASVASREQPEGFLASIKGVVANLFIKPVKVTQLGNETMLNFGHAIFRQQPEFSFPKATNIKEDRLVTSTRPGVIESSAK